jgi:hypothetical protein
MIKTTLTILLLLSIATATTLTVDSWQMGYGAEQQTGTEAENMVGEIGDMRKKGSPGFAFQQVFERTH